MDQQKNDIVELLRIMLKWKKPILIVTIGMAVGSAAFSWFFMPNYYKSSVIFYPSNPVMNDRQVLYSNSYGEIKIDYFGSSADVDRILTVANTSAIEDYIINKYQLIEHYGYDSTKVLARYKTKKHFEKNYRAAETQYGAIEISVWDKDKNLASTMANHIVETIDNQNKELLLRDKNILIETFKQNIDEKEKELRQLTDSIEIIKSSNPSPEQLQVLEKNIASATDNLNENKRILAQYEISASQKFSTVHITEPAFPAIRKDKPMRSLIVIGATLGAFLFMLILAVLVENYRKIKSRLYNA